MFLTDLYNQVSIKPQENASMTEFPMGTVSVDGRINQDPKVRFEWQTQKMESVVAKSAPAVDSAPSLTVGELRYNTYCIVCHGDTTKTNEQGLADTKLNKLGMLAPAMIAQTPSLSDEYLFNKIKHGGTIMPALGYSTTNADRWNIVGYVRGLEKGK